MTTFEEKTTNEAIAELLQQQTYEERMKLAAWFRDTINDRKSDMGDGDFTPADLAELFGGWATAELEESDD